MGDTKANKSFPLAGWGEAGPECAVQFQLSPLWLSGWIWAALCMLKA